MTDAPLSSQTNLEREGSSEAKSLVWKRGREQLLLPSHPGPFRQEGKHASLHSCERNKEELPGGHLKDLLLKGECFPQEKLNEHLYPCQFYQENSVSPSRNVMPVYGRTLHILSSQLLVHINLPH